MTRRVALALVAILALALAACDSQSSSPLNTANRLTIVGANGVSHDFTIEVAATDEARETGLMFRTHLDPDAGMLFWFGKSEVNTAFWMKNTPLPLDMLFIRASGVISLIHANAQPNDTTEILSGGPVAAVLEINGGRAAALGIAVGDQARYPLFGP